MRKVHRNPDGTEEVLEGDPEELRKYERLGEEQQPVEPAPVNESPKKPGILHGHAVDGVPVSEEELKGFDDYIRLIRQLRQVPTEKVVSPSPWGPVDPHKVGDPIWVVSCSMCRRVGCNGRCAYLIPDHYPWWYRLTTTGVSTGASTERISFLMQEDGSSKPSHSLADVLMGRASVEVKTNGN